MSALTTLKLSTAKKSQAMTPAVHRRLKLGKKIWEQIELAKATSAGGTYTVRRFKTIRDEEGYSYPGFKFTGAGWSWVLENKNEFVLKKGTSSRRAAAESDIPF